MQKCWKHPPKKPNEALKSVGMPEYTPNVTGARSPTKAAQAHGNDIPLSCHADCRANLDGNDGVKKEDFPLFQNEKSYVPLSPSFYTNETSKSKTPRPEYASAECRMPPFTVLSPVWLRHSRRFSFEVLEQRRFQGKGRSIVNLRPATPKPVDPEPLNPKPEPLRRSRVDAFGI